jgi:O-antigen ligase
MDILKIAIIVAITLLPLGELLRIPLGNNSTLHPLDIAVAFISLIWLYKKAKEKKSKPYTSAKAIGIFTLIIIFSLLANLTWLTPLQTGVASLYFLRWLTYAGVYFALAGSEESLKKYAVKSLTIAGGIIVLLGFLQLIFFPNLLPLFPLGWDKHVYRMVSTFLDPNFAGAFFVLYLLLLSSQLPSQKAKKKVLFYIMFILTLIAVILTNSRSALLMLVGAAATYLFLIKKFHLIFTLLGILLLSFIILLPFSHIENLNLLRTNSSKARIQSWQNALQIFQKNPLLGVGFNTYRYAQIKYKLISAHTPVPSHADAGTDNSFLFILATTGIIGFVFYLAIWVNIIKEQQKGVIQKVLLASCIGLIINAFFINSLFYPTIMFWMWALAGVNHSK